MQLGRQREPSGTWWKKKLEENLREQERKENAGGGEDTHLCWFKGQRVIITERVFHGARLNSRLYLASLIKFTPLVPRLFFWVIGFVLWLCRSRSNRPLFSMSYTAPGFPCVPDLFPKPHSPLFHLRSLSPHLQVLTKDTWHLEYTLQQFKCVCYTSKMCVLYICI